jgi:hypothetical protein
MEISATPDGMNEDIDSPISRAENHHVQVVMVARIGGRGRNAFETEPGTLQAGMRQGFEVVRGSELSGQLLKHAIIYVTLLDGEVAQ